MGGGREGCLLSYRFLTLCFSLYGSGEKGVSRQSHTVLLMYCHSPLPTHTHTNRHTHTAPPSCHGFQLYFLCLSITGSTHANHSIFVPGFLSVHHFSPLCLYNTLYFPPKFYGRSVYVPATSHLSHICRDMSKETHMCLFRIVIFLTQRLS